ncbi:MAG TPA: response regulator [Anaeromyxobacter sp.]
MFGPPRSLRVLIVDDNHLIRRLLALIVEGAGFEAIETESGEDALALGRDAPPDLWLVDEVMPSMKGSELVRALRRARDRRLACAPIVGISGRAGAATDLLAAGCDAFVPKPVDEHALVDALRRAVAARRGGRPDHLPAA